MLRMPQTRFGPTAGKTGFDTLQAELLSEQAASLGRAGQAIERSLRALHEATHDDPARPALLKAAAKAVYAYLIQRELLGFRDQETVIESFAIPREVLAKLGVWD